MRFGVNSLDAGWIGFDCHAFIGCFQYECDWIIPRLFCMIY
jgi:hypothetical protein